MTQWPAFLTVTIRGNTAVPGGQPLSSCKGQAHNVKQAVKPLQALFSLYTPWWLFLPRLPKCWQRSNVPLFPLTHCILSTAPKQKPEASKRAAVQDATLSSAAPGDRQSLKISPTAAAQMESLNCDVSTGLRLAGAGEWRAPGTGGGAHKGAGVA